MKHTKRILCAVLAVALVMSMMLSGCTIPSITIPGTPDVAVTYGDGQEISTGEYLAYLFMNFSDIYSNYSYYAQYGLDPWEQTVPYTDEDGKDAKMTLEEYIIDCAKKTIENQLALEKIIKDNNLPAIEDEEKAVDTDLADLPENAYLPYGISDEHFSSVYRGISLNQRRAFFGLYGKGGIKEVKDKEIRKYFDENYLSYKIISIPLTKTENNETKNMTDKEKKEVMDKLNGYLKICNEKGFEKAMDQYNKDNAAKDEKVEATKDEDNRNDVDKTTEDESLVKEIEKIAVGKAAVVEYKANGSTPTAVLIQRLDPNEPKKLYEDEYENILISLKNDAFTKLVEKEVKGLNIVFNDKVIAQCSPKKFAE